MRSPSSLACVCGLAVGAFADVAMCQWSADPMQCLAVGDRSGEQNQPKIAATPDDGCYISWFDNSTGGYDVYLQRLDALGNEQWAHNGVLVADRGVSSTVDYDLICDASGNAIIAYNDDTIVAGSQQIQVQKVSPAGALLWGEDGVTVSDGSAAFKANPQLAALSDGNVAVGFSQDNTIPLVRLSPTGQMLWAAPVVVSETFNPPTQPLNYIGLSDLQPSVSGGFVALYIRSRTQSSLSNKSLYAQKFDAAGQPLWTGAGVSNNAGNPVIVYDAGTTNGIGNGYQPTFLSDGAGGAVFGWYENGGQRNAYIQHILASGALKFPAPVGSTAATVGRIRLGASLAYTADQYFLVTTEGTSVSTVADSVLAQKFGADGARLWGDTGVYLQAITANSQPSFVQAVEHGGGVMGFWITPAGSATGIIAGAYADPQGDVAWTNTPCSAQGTKARLTSAKSTQGYAILAFGHSGDIWAQNTRPDGSLGNPPSTCYANCDASTTAPVLNVADFTCFLQRFAAGESYANCDGSTTPPTLNVADFTCFLQSFAAGCP